jgi:dienelactone hydrolase
VRNRFLQVNDNLKILLSGIIATALVTGLRAQSLPGLTVTNNNFTYTAPDGLVTGIIRMPTGSGPFPAVLISHGKGGTAGNFSLQHANILVGWGFACIGPSYTHEGSTVNPPDNEGYCPENSRRARRAIEILASAPNVDMSRLALFGHSMGSFITGGLAGEIPAQIKAACISAGGTAGLADPGFASPTIQEVQAITAPFLMFHGTEDNTVFPSQSVNLQNILTGNGISNKRLLYQGIDHDIASATVKRTDIHAIMRAWFTRHGVLAFAGNTAPTMVVPATVTAANGTSSSPITITLGDAQTVASSLTLEAFTTDDLRLPNSSIVLGGSGANRTLTLSPPAGQTGSVEVTLVVNDGQLSTESFLNVTLENPASSSVNHHPECSWIPDQRTTPGSPVTGIAFTIGDPETAASALTVTAVSSNAALLPPSNITLGGSGAGRTISLTPAAGQNGISTVTVTVSDGEKSNATAFTLTVAAVVSGNTAPIIQAVPGGTIPTGGSHGSLPLIVKDTEQAESALTVTASSSNNSLVPVANIAIGGQNYGRTVQVTPAASQSGRATITLTVSDGTNTSSTAFVLDVVSGDTPPVIGGLPGVVQSLLENAPSPVNFTIQDAETAASALRVTASSSNPSLLPDSNITLSGTGGSRSLSITPVIGQSGAATVTLVISDGTFTRREQLLFVVTDPTAASARFSRPRGVFILDSGTSANYTTTFGSAISLRDANIRNLPFVDGFTLRVAWTDVESGTTPGHYDFFIIQNLLAKLPAGLRLSIIIVPGEPAYIANTPGVQTWSDAGTLRATPWDPYLRQRRRAMLAAMGGILNGGIALREDPRLDLLNPYLPGGFTGIRDPNSTPLRNLPDYTRQRLLDAVRDELHAIQGEFPGKFVQLGFWPITDNENIAYGGVTAAEWLRQELLEEFNGITRPRVGFFMENLAAKRTALDADIYSGTPVTGFGTALFASRDETWNGFQMLGSWVRPFNDGHVTNTFFGTPNDALEFAFNTYRGEYHEIYIGDIEHPAWQASLQRWHNFYASEATTSRNSDEDGDGLPLAWEKQLGLSPTLHDSADDDSDHDSLPLLLEYAFHQNPSQAGSPAIPATNRVTDPNTGLTYLHIQYPRRTDASHLQYSVQVAETPDLWLSGPGFSEEIGTTHTGDGITELVTVRILPEISSHDRRFVRVAVTSP